MANYCATFRQLEINQPVHLLNTEITLVEPWADNIQAGVASARLPNGKHALLIRVQVGIETMNVSITGLSSGDVAWIRVLRRKPSILEWMFGSAYGANLEFLKTSLPPEVNPEFEILALIKLEADDPQPDPTLDFHSMTGLENVIGRPILGFGDEFVYRRPGAIENGYLRPNAWDLTSLENGLGQMRTTTGQCRQQTNLPRKFNINVRFLGNRAKPYPVTVNTTVEELKEMVKEQQAYPTSQQKVLLDFRELQDGHTLSSYGVREESTIFIVERLFGG